MYIRMYTHTHIGLTPLTRAIEAGKLPLVTSLLSLGAAGLLYLYMRTPLPILTYIAGLFYVYSRSLLSI